MQRLTLLVGTVLLSFSLSSCTELFDLPNNSSDHTEFTGPKVAVGDGYAWAYIIVDSHEYPRSIGIRFEEDALNNLPVGSHHADEFVLHLPDDVSVAPYDHLTLDWNERGHEPPGIYDVPHFDAHFYFMSLAERDKISPADTAEFNKPLASQYLAPNYLETPGGVPRMGAHIIDLESPEIAGSGPFTYTFIYGKYNGMINFLEPMVALAFLESRASVRQSIRWPEEWQRSGYYPQEYTIEYDEHEGIYSVALSKLKWWEE